jgi:hypothetical protein
MRWAHRRWQLVIGSILVLLAVLSLFGSCKASRDLSKSNGKLTSYVQCQQRWNSFLYVSLNSARTSSTEANQALDNLIDAVTQAKSPEETRAALETYKTARTKQKQTTADNPLPPPPEEVCEI